MTNNKLIELLEDITGDAAFTGLGESLQERIYAEIENIKLLGQKHSKKLDEQAKKEKTAAAHKEHQRVEEARRNSELKQLELLKKKYGEV